MIQKIFYRLYKLLKTNYNKERYNRFRKKYKIHDTFKFNGSEINFHGDGEIKIAEDSYIGEGSSIQSIEGQKVIIGKNCAISHNVRIFTGSRDPKDIINEREKIRFKESSVEIGDNCWIGANVVIIQNVKIGANSVIGANSIVTRDIPSNSIAVGIPAKVISKKEEKVN